jgi:hypothetical protein
MVARSGIAFRIKDLEANMAMTLQELEQELKRVTIKLTLIEGCLMQNSTLPILGPMKNWDDYKSALDRETAKAGL